MIIPSWPATSTQPPPFAPHAPPSGATGAIASVLVAFSGH
jgi:hypothetical protein